VPIEVEYAEVSLSVLHMLISVSSFYLCMARFSFLRQDHIPIQAG